VRVYGVDCTGAVAVLNDIRLVALVGTGIQ
jgi:hypothetical protein